MLETNSGAFIQLGIFTQCVKTLLHYDQAFEQHDLAHMTSPERSQEKLRSNLSQLLELSIFLDLQISSKILRRKLDCKENLLKTPQELRILVEVVQTEIETKLCLFLPSHRAKYYNRKIPDKIISCFGTVARELELSGNSIAFGLTTASVFHSMRAAEIGVQVMGSAIGVTFTYPIDLAGWGAIISEIEKKLITMKTEPRTLQRDEDLTFYSDAASQFRHFNSAWRVRIAHARASADEDEAIRVLDHTIEFFVTLSNRLKE